MAANASFLEDDLCCCVCFDIFKDPVVLECSHNFCGACLEKFWEEKSSRECPVCRKESSINPLPNLALKNIVESYLKRANCESPRRNEACCRLHGEKLKLFCEDDEELLCVVCQTSKKHENHKLCPAEEAAPDLKRELKSAKNFVTEKLGRFKEFKRACEETAEHIWSQVQHTERQVKAEFEKLHQFLRDEEEARLAALREEEELKSLMMKEKMEHITSHIRTLSDKITAIENAMDSEDISFLKTYKNNKRRAQCALQDPDMISGALIDVAKHLGNLKFRVWEKMLGMVQYTPVTLDPNTAAPWLCLSDDLTSVTGTGDKQDLPDNPERFDSCVSVLGSEGFTSGKHRWEVEVGDKPAWTIGVVKKSIHRKGQIKCDPVRGFWVITLRNGEYKVAGVKRLSLKKKPQRIRVQLDYDRGKVFFIDTTNMSHVYTFNDTFTERLFPYFSPSINIDGNNAGALCICPVKPSVTVIPSL
ncbi:tripartite motif-containing protein 35-like [Megalops cyprinoides]|uniref:tripartite motif-containing protein 35-like n=1 Tax=Megalops cyprinoides TaxID=118141 RepID=UPI0018650DA1|nr:tripartite motif-containing protein 35-like [Megalops cyprinoides]